MTDIVERLRTGTSGFITWEVKPIDLVAAAEIERLRAELQDWKAAYYADTKRIEAERDRLRGEVEAARREEREACAAVVDCGCDIRDAVLARLESKGERYAAYLCQQGSACCALQASAIRARGDA